MVTPDNFFMAVTLIDENFNPNINEPDDELFQVYFYFLDLTFR
jgi:hypothetical protein